MLQELIEGLDRVKNSFNSYTLDRLAIAGAEAALKDTEYFTEITGKIIATRNRVTARLKNLGFDVPDSKANFVFIQHESLKAVDIFPYLRSKGILVRYFNKDKIDNRLRVTIGTDEEMDCFLSALEEYVNERG